MARWPSAAELDRPQKADVCMLSAETSWQLAASSSLKEVVGVISHVYHTYQNKSSVILLAFFMFRKWLLQLKVLHAIQNTKEEKKQ